MIAEFVDGNPLLPAAAEVETPVRSDALLAAVAAEALAFSHVFFLSMGGGSGF